MQRAASALTGASFLYKDDKRQMEASLLPSLRLVSFYPLDWIMKLFKSHESLKFSLSIKLIN